jgi:hypothetical protein
MHAQHWDDHTIYNFKEEDIPNIRKIFTHKWVTPRESNKMVGEVKARPGTWE